MTASGRGCVRTRVGLDEIVRGQFGAVVADDRVWPLPSPANDVIEFSRNAPAGARGVGDQCQAFSGAVVDHRQDAEAPAVGQLVRDKVQAPALVRCLRGYHRSPCPQRPLASAAPTHRQPLLAVESLHPLLVDSMAFTPQQHVQATIPKPPSLLGEGLQPLAQDHVVWSHALIAHARPIGPDHPAGPPLSLLEGLTHTRRRLPSRRGRHPFFPSRSFSAALSSMVSASIRFSRPFSSSSARSRLVSDPPTPPYLAFHL